MPSLSHLARSVWAVAALVAVLPATAGAATATVENNFANFRDATGEANTVTVTESGESVTFADSTAPVTAGDGCTQNTANQVTCTSDALQAVLLELGAGDDRAEAAGSFTLSFQARGGEGDDIINGSDTFDALSGGGGADQIYGRGSNDLLRDSDGGGDGAGRDTLDGGTGNDTVEYDDRASDEPVVINLTSPGPADDQIVDVESIVTGRAADRVVGDDDDNTVTGGGQDIIDGRGGDDRLDTDAGGRLEGGEGDDVLDVAVTEFMSQTKINCGPGFDEVRSWPTDRLKLNCERAWAGRIYINVNGLRTYNKKLLREKHVLRLTAMCAHGDQARGCTGKVDMLRRDKSRASRGRYEVHEDWARVEFKLRRADRKRLRKGHLFTFQGLKSGSYGFQMHLEL